jgi:predicted nuclease of restriction endonuclease-like (RecB) superfamily
LKKVNTGKYKTASSSGSYAELLVGIKNRVQAARVRAGLAANRELILLYWDIGRLVAERQDAEGWGASVIDRLSTDIRHDSPDLKGFSARNIRRMSLFDLSYREQFVIWPQVVAKLDGSKNEILPQAVAEIEKGAGFPPVLQLPWAHNVLLIEKIKDFEKRLWYMRQAIEHGWSRNVLALHIDQQDYERKGLAVTNFSATLPSPQSDLAQELLKDPYIFDFLGIADDAREKEGSNKMLLEYALCGLEKPVGVSAYQLTRALPDNLKPSLPAVEEIEIEIAEKVEEDNDGEAGMIIREWAEKYRTRTAR